MATIEDLTTQKQQISVTLQQIADRMREVVGDTDLSEQEQEGQINELKQRIDAELLKRHTLSVQIINILMGQPESASIEASNQASESIEASNQASNQSSESIEASNQAGGSRKRRRRRKTKRR